MIPQEFYESTIEIHNEQNVLKIHLWDGGVHFKINDALFNMDDEQSKKLFNHLKLKFT